MKFLIILLTVPVLLFSCNKKKDYFDGDHFFIKNDGAEMPVIVKGNIESKTFILFLHGGPGSGASLVSFMPLTEEIEKDYAFVYWDQRGSGMSQGNPDESTFTLEQFVEDLDLVVDAIKKRYDNPRIVLYGVSWGGALGSAYLSTGDLQDKIDGFICMNSGHNMEVGIPLSVQWVKEYGIQQVALGNDVDYWNEYINWCNTNPDMKIAENYFHYYEYLVNTNAYQKDPNQQIQGPEVGMIGSTSSYLSLSVFFSGKYLRPNFNILSMNLSEDMERIKIKSLVIWGRHDGVNTIEMGYDAFNSIGGPGFNDKEMVILENSAHMAHVEEQELFIKTMKDFMVSL